MTKISNFNDKNMKMLQLEKEALQTEVNWLTHSHFVCPIIVFPKVIQLSHIVFIFCSE